MRHKRSGWARIEEIGNGSIETRGVAGLGAAICSGDSGGPLFHDGLVAGVASASACEETSSYAQVAASLEVIERAIAAASSAAQEERDGDAPAASEGDDSCRFALDGECDEGTYCEQGTDATDCAGARCPPGTCERDGWCDEDMDSPYDPDCDGGGGECADYDYMTYCVACDGWDDSSDACCGYDDESSCDDGGWG